MKNFMIDPGARPEVTAAALAKAAIQTAQRAVFTAHLAAEAMKGTAALDQNDANILADLRDKLLDAFAAVPSSTRQRFYACTAELTSDELIDLLALSVQG